MATTKPLAAELIIELARAVIEGQDVLALLGYTPEFREFGKSPATDKPPVNRFWAVAMLTDEDSPQKTLGPIGKRLHTTRGYVSILVNAPMTAKDNLKKARAISVLVRNAYRDSTASSVWFRRARSNDQPPSDQGQFRVIAIANYEFDERG